MEPRTGPVSDPPVDKISDLEYLDELKFVRHARVHVNKTPRSLWQLSARFRARMTVHLDNGMAFPLTIKAPRGLYTDLASVPDALWSIVGPIGRHLEASILHDYLYMAWTDFRAKAVKRDWDFADGVLRAGMKVSKVRKRQNHLRRRALAHRLGRLPQEALHPQGAHGRLAAAPRRRPRPRDGAAMMAAGLNRWRRRPGCGRAAWPRAARPGRRGRARPGRRKPAARQRRSSAWR